MFFFFSFRTCHHDARLEIQNFLAAAGATETMMENSTPNNSRRTKWES